jgi:L-asparaginase
MNAVDDYLLGNEALHERFRVATEIMGKLVLNAPHPLSVDELEKDTGQSGKDVVKLCNALARAQLVRPNGKVSGSWILADKPGAFTLEDVFRCVIAEHGTRSKMPAVQNSRGSPQVDLLVMQASLAINQSMFKHLRQFSLDRLSMGAPVNSCIPVAKLPEPGLHYDECDDDLSNFKISFRSPSPNMTLRILATGGTFDKYYDEIAGKLMFSASHMPSVIERARINGPIELEELPFLDSLDMQDADRERILQACQASVDDHIIVIHGTDTMSETAALLGKARMEKTIVLTGAVIPYEIANSDALFNFGFACGVTKMLPHGVYIAMNAQVFAWDKVQKNRAAGVFEAL